MEKTITDTKRSTGLIRFLLICGILSSLLYLAMNVFIPMYWQDYNSASQTVSELSAIDAPTRPIWILPGIVYTLLVTAFGLGILATAQRNRPLYVVGILMFIHGLIGLFWPPMHQREVLAAGGGSLTDTLHIVFSIITVLFFLLEIGFGAAAFGKRFRYYSVITMILLITFGALTGLDSPNISQNLPTPLIGIWERINIGVFMIWVVVLAINLLSVEKRKAAVRFKKLRTKSSEKFAVAER